MELPEVAVRRVHIETSSASFGVQLPEMIVRRVRLEFGGLRLLLPVVTTIQGGELVARVATERVVRWL